MAADPGRGSATPYPPTDVEEVSARVSSLAAENPHPTPLPQVCKNRLRARYACWVAYQKPPGCSGLSQGVRVLQSVRPRWLQ